MSHGPALEEVRWGLHSIVTIDGVPYGVFQQWELWYAKQRGTDGMSVAMEKMPTENIELIALKDVLDEGIKKRLVEEHL